MTQALELKPGMKVLEVGAGSGYQSALISEIVGPKGKVITIEFLDNLYLFAKQNLKAYKNVKIIKGDGSQGYKKGAPYDRIIVTCAAPAIPSPLLDQLKTKGILLIPVGSLYTQRMMKVVKTKKGVSQEDLGLFAFVPLRGKHGFSY
jgi:protein-L-isoaspartate(D-aspartate) O-methyltransferase